MLVPRQARVPPRLPPHLRRPRSVPRAESVSFVVPELGLRLTVGCVVGEREHQDGGREEGGRYRAS